MNSIIQKNIALNQRNQVQKEHRARVAAGEKIDRDWYSDDDDEDDLAYGPWEDLDEDRPVPTMTRQMVMRAIRDLYENQKRLENGVREAKTRANNAVGYAALALFALGFTLLSAAVRHFTN